ncbi:hypothetical protein [Sphingobium sp. D43FB]|uniref:hypothetical protein n=1 Tax=Sphingobium sp. D43FB TaxID=2017595 RepID=UPI0020D0C191|nr:hypothetical protein [Sphingobium sp. D43FB]
MTNDKSGQPLRFLALLMIAWVAIRIAAQSGPSPLNPLPLVRGRPATAAIVPQQFSAKPPTRKAVIPRAVAIKPAALRVSGARIARNMVDVALDPTPHSSAPAPAAISDGPTEAPYAFPSPLPIPAPGPPNRADRWHGSSWMLWRGGGMSQTDLARTGRLGGSQVGARLDYVLNPAARHRATAYARASSALDSPAAPEAAIGISLQPFTPLPVNVAIERRIALGAGARDAMAVMAVGGFGPTPVALGMEAQAYAQTGIVGFRQRDAFIDGKLSLLTPVQNTAMRVGAAISGGAQPGVERLDIGPEIQVRLPLQPVAARLSIEWRERIAGRAAPASGLALTLGADF